MSYWVFFPRKTNSKKAIKGKQVMPVLPATPCLSRLNVCYSSQQSFFISEIRKDGNKLELWLSTRVANQKLEIYIRSINRKLYFRLTKEYMSILIAYRV
jgi:hypothetical protein